MDNDKEVLIRDESKEKEELKEPPNYKVVILNDDFTPMEFVVEILKAHFGKTMETATIIMLDVHAKGKGVAGVYTKDIAETKASNAIMESIKQEHPLQFNIEPE